MRRAICNVISVLISQVRLSLLRLMHGANLNCGKTNRLSPNVVLEIEKNSQVSLGDRNSIHSGCKIKVRSGANLQIGNRVFLNYGCMLMCRCQIAIGDGCEFGPNVLIYDHDHDVHAEGGIKAKKYKSAPVVIGENCWIGANSVILKGVTIGSGAVIGAGSVITCDVPANTVVVQKRVCTEFSI